MSFAMVAEPPITAVKPPIAKKPSRIPPRELSNARQKIMSLSCSWEWKYNMLVICKIKEIGLDIDKVVNA